MVVFYLKMQILSWMFWHGYHTAAIGRAIYSPLPHWRQWVRRLKILRRLRKLGAEKFLVMKKNQFNTGSGRHGIDTPYYGFMHVDMVTEHGDQCGDIIGSGFGKTCQIGKP